MIDLETANNEFERWAEAMDLDLDESYMDAEDLTNFRKQKRRVLKAMTRGALMISEEGLAIYTPQNPRSKHQEPITFNERTGASLMAMDGKKKGYDVAKTYAVLADMCRLPPAVFAGMVGEDSKVCEALLAFLMD